MLSYESARRLLGSARAKSNGKPLENNTRLYERSGSHAPGGTYYAVRFHETDVVEIYSNGTYGIRHGGWRTMSTQARIFTYSPLTWRNILGRVERANTLHDTSWKLVTRDCGAPVPFDGLVRISRDGFPLVSEVRRLRGQMYRARLRETASRHEAARAERERRAIERFKASVRRRRKPTFEQRAAEVAAELAAIAEGLKVSVTINDSSEE